MEPRAVGARVRVRPETAPATSHAGALGTVSTLDVCMARACGVRLDMCPNDVHVFRWGELEPCDEAVARYAAAIDAACRSLGALVASVPRAVGSHHSTCPAWARPGATCSCSHVEVSTWTLEGIIRGLRL